MGINSGFKGLNMIFSLHICC